RLQSSRFVSLYLAVGLFDTGQGESVVALRITSNSNVFNFSLPRVVSVPKFLLQPFGKPFVFEFIPVPFEDRCFIKHLFAVFEVKIRDSINGHAPGKACGYDLAGAGSGKKVEIVGKHELFSTSLLFSQQFLDLRQNLNRENAANPSPVQRQNFFWTIWLDLFKETHVSPPYQSFVVSST